MKNAISEQGMVYNNTFIYIITDPNGGYKAYIGKSNTPMKRYSDHMCDRTKTLKSNWIRQLHGNNVKPRLDILDEVPLKDWQFWEQHYISLYKSWGFNLVNGDNGGYGHGRVSQELKDKIRKTLTGKRKGIKTGPMSEDIKLKISEAKKGQVPYMAGRKHKKESLLKAVKTRMLNDSYKKSEESKHLASASLKKAWSEGRFKRENVLPWNKGLKSSGGKINKNNVL